MSRPFAVVVGAAFAVLVVGCVPPPEPPPPTTTTVPAEACSPGEFSASGAEPCTPTPAGSFVAAAGATTPTSCPVGTFQPDTGQTECLNAPLGFYVPGTGATAATPAEAGTFIDTEAAASATPCALGSYQPNTASTSCLLAPIGSFVDAIGSSTATACPSGTTTLSVGSTSADDCIPEGINGAVDIASGESHSCALLADGTARCWGNNGSGQLGDGMGGIGNSSNVPVTVSGLANAVAITAGANHSCAVLGDGTARCWGQNVGGQLGNGTGGFLTNSNVPVGVSGLANAVAITAGFSHSCALLGDGTARCWGNNSFGRLGDGADISSNVPVVVSGLANAVAITAGAAHSCAVLGDGTARCWGRNSTGLLGDGTTTDSSVPVTVSGLANAVAITAGGEHSCAVLGDGTARCWGFNGDGRLGNGTFTSFSNVPVVVSGLTDAVAITAGAFHSCAVLGDGTARCWGGNLTGQLGNGTQGLDTESNVPVTVSGLANAVAIDAANHSCALLGDGAARCWGDNVGGQLGDGTTINSNVPVTVVGIP